MEFLPLSRRRSSARNVPIGEERGETDVFAGYLSLYKLEKKPEKIQGHTGFKALNSVIPVRV